MSTSSPALSRDNAVASAIALLDAQGAGALTMRALAREMDVPVMSLYRHVASKDDLDRAIVAALVAGIEPVAADDAPWDEAIRHWAVSYRAMLRQHPNASPLMSAFPAAAYGARAEDAEQLLGALVQAGLSPAATRLHLRAAMITITGFCTTQVTAEAMEAAADPATPTPPADAYPLLAALVDDVREHRNSDAVFEAMLDAVIAGLHAAIGAAGTSR